MKLELEVKDKQLADVLDSAGSKYWCKELRWPDADFLQDDTCWEALLAGRIDHVTVVEDRSEEGKGPLRHKVTREKVAKAAQIILDKYPHHLGAVLGNSEDADAETGDVLLQCAALGDIVYG